MKKIKIIAGIAWAFAGLILILVLFPGLNSFSETASGLPFMKVNPNYTGGEVARQIISEGCTLEIRRPALNLKVKDVEISTQTSYGWALRIGLIK